MWDLVLESCVSLLQTDQQLIALLGGPHIYRGKSLPQIQTPGVFWTIIANTLGENYAPVSIQWDIFANDTDAVSKIELRIYRLMHSDLPVTFGTLTMWSLFQTGFDFAEEDETISHRAVEYKYIPAREQG